MNLQIAGKAYVFECTSTSETDLRTDFVRNNNCLRTDLVCNHGPCLHGHVLRISAGSPGNVHATFLVTCTVQHGPQLKILMATSLIETVFCWVCVCVCAPVCVNRFQDYSIVLPPAAAAAVVVVVVGVIVNTCRAKRPPYKYVQTLILQTNLRLTLQTPMGARACVQSKFAWQQPW